MKQMVKTGLCLIVGLAGSAMAQEAARGQFRGASTAVRFDVSPPLRTIAPLPPADRDPGWYGSLMVDPDSGRKPRDNNAPDGRAQTMLPFLRAMPAPGVSFNAGTGSANPPDPVGAVGPNYYLRMANSSFQIFSKTGTSAFGPANINTLFAGFGGACATENAGDPVVIYDQLADRWLLSQFSDSSGPGFFNCVALSTSGDPLGTWYRWAFATPVFPDYPKYGMWPNAFVITTRELDAGEIGVYGVDRAQMLAGNASPTLVRFGVPVDPYSGDGLLPADLDGSTLPPAGAPVYLVGSMDDGGPYGAAQDALALWELDLDFVTPASSALAVVKTLPIAPYDTNFPCSGRSCVPQPAPLGAVDILSYRQRPTFRAAYRNFGSYQAIVATQSVEGAPNMAGMRWWEIRAPGASAELYQDSTYVPGATDGIHRWMGSIAQDRSGNIGLGYSASSTSVYPDVRYSGRLEADPLNELGQGEGTLVTAAGGHTEPTTRRWGDYTALTVDPTDDCTFWYVNQYFVTSGTTWTLRVGSFKFPDCGTPNLGIATSPLTQSGCVGSDISIGVQAHAYDGFNSPAALSVSGVPVGMTSSFAPASIATIPGTSTLTLGNTGTTAPGTYTVQASATTTGPALVRTRPASFTLFAAAPAAPTAIAPAPGAVEQNFAPNFSWTSVADTEGYVLELATDAAFTNIVHTSPSLSGTSYALPVTLAGATTYHWRVSASNGCGPAASAVASFTTRAAPGTCAVGEQLLSSFSDDVEAGVGGWTTDPVSGNTWTRSTARPASGSYAWLAVDLASTSDQRLISPTINLPAAQNSLTLRFQHDVTMEQNTATSCWDGGFVEVSSDGGTNWNPLGASRLLESPFLGPVPTGQQAWCGTAPYRTASFDLGDFAGQAVKFRFRALTDSSVGSVPHGWYVDDVRVEGCFNDPNAVFRDGFE